MIVTDGTKTRATVTIRWSSIKRVVWKARLLRAGNLSSDQGCQDAAATSRAAKEQPYRPSRDVFLPGRYPGAQPYCCRRVFAHVRRISLSRMEAVVSGAPLGDENGCRARVAREEHCSYRNQLSRF